MSLGVIQCFGEVTGWLKTIIIYGSHFRLTSLWFVIIRVGFRVIHKSIQVKFNIICINIIIIMLKINVSLKSLKLLFVLFILPQIFNTQ